MWFNLSAAYTRLTLSKSASDGPFLGIGPMRTANRSGFHHDYHQRLLGRGLLGDCVFLTVEPQPIRVKLQPLLRDAAGADAKSSGRVLGGRVEH